MFFGFLGLFLVELGVFGGVEWEYRSISSEIGRFRVFGGVSGRFGHFWGQFQGFGGCFSSNLGVLGGVGGGRGG